MVTIAVATAKRHHAQRKQGAQQAKKQRLDKRCSNKPAITGAAALAAVVFIETYFAMAFS
jgi:hypothetical protein